MNSFKVLPHTINHVRALRLPDVMQRTGLSRSHTYKMVKDGLFPAPTKISERISVWDEREIDAWLASKFAGSIN